MANEYTRNAVVGGGGTYAFAILPRHLQAAAEVGSLSCYAAYFIAEFNRTSHANHGQRLALPGIVDTSPISKDNRLADGFTGDPAVVDRTRALWERDAALTVDQTHQVWQQQYVVAPLAVLTIGCRSGHYQVTEFIARRMHEKKPDLNLVLKTALPEEPEQRPDAIPGYELFVELHRRWIAAVTIMSDNDGPHPRAFKVGVSDTFQAKHEASLVAARAMFLKNKGLPEIGKSLGKLSPFAGASYASRNLQSFATWRERMAWSLLGRRASYEQRRLFWIDHVVREAQLALTEALTALTARAIAEDIRASLPCFACFTIPVERTDQLAWENLPR